MRVRVLALLLAATLGGCASADIAVNRGFDFSRVKRVAVVAFKDGPSRAGSGDLLTAAFEQSLLRAGYDVVGHDEVAKALAEHKLPAALDTKSAAVAGQLLNVDAFVSGRITTLVAPREAVATTTVESDQTNPVFGRRHKIQRPDGTWMEITDVDYKTSRTYVKRPQAYQVSGKLGVNARMTYAPTGAMLWSGSESLDISSLDDGAHALADDVLKGVKSTWPRRP